MSQLRAVLGGRLESRPYRIGLDVRCDVTDVLLFSHPAHLDSVRALAV